MLFVMNKARPVDACWPQVVEAVEVASLSSLIPAFDSLTWQVSSYVVCWWGSHYGEVTPAPPCL